MTSESARRILNKVEETWRSFRELADRLGPDGLEEKTPAGWTAKEMLATIAFWDEAAFGWITTGIRQQPLPDGWRFGSGYMPSESWPRADEHNAREAQWGRVRSVTEILDRCDRAHEQLLAIVDTITEEEAEKNQGYFAQIGDHYLDHLPELKALATGAGA